MCGIMGYTGSAPCLPFLLEGLGRLEYRGYDSSGVAWPQEGAFAVYKAQGPLERLRERLQGVRCTAGCGIGHTRWATHGAPSDRNSHPHTAGRVCLVHNGIIENHRELRERLAADGAQFLSETDTEVLARLLDSLYEGDPLRALRRALALAQGSWALAVLFADAPQHIWAVRHESPLVVGCGEGAAYLASDMQALLPYTRRFLLPQEGEVVLLAPQGVTIFDPAGAVVQRQPFTSDMAADTAGKGGWPHFMLKEIHEQPQALRRAVAPRLREGLPDFAPEGLDDAFFAGVRQVWLVGCGSACHAGMTGGALLEGLARLPARVQLASEFRYADPLLGPEDLVIAISQSGETQDTLAALRLAAAWGCRTLAVVNVVGSAIAREAQHVLYTHAGAEIAVASTKAYTVQLAVLTLLALRFALARGQLSAQQARRLCGQLQMLPQHMQAQLENKEALYEAAQRCRDAKNLFFIGRGTDHAPALEGSLKLKEISYVHSEACAAGELKHGTLSLITPGMPVVALATQARVVKKTLSNLREARARGAWALLVCRADAPLLPDEADCVLRLPPLPDALMPLALAVPLQLFAYYMSVLRGCEVDKPRNLAKSVTVE